MPNLLANNLLPSQLAKTPAIEVLNLISIQRESHEKFLQMSLPQSDRDATGLQAVFKSVFPIQDFSQRASLQFVGYDLEIPKQDVDECRERGMTFSAPLKVTSPSSGTSMPRPRPAPCRTSRSRRSTSVRSRS